jgi:transposase
VRDEVLTDELWARLEPLIPVPPRRFRYPGRKRAQDRAALEGILYAVRTGIGWNRLPTSLFGASGATCWRRLTEWQQAGVWQELHERLLAELRAAGRLDLTRVLVDSSHLRALKGGTTPAPARSTAPNPAPNTI